MRRERFVQERGEAFAIREPVDAMIGATLALLRERAEFPNRKPETRLFKGELIRRRSA